MVAKGGNIAIAHRGLELDHRMRLVVWIGGITLAAGAEIGIVADGTFEAIASDVALTPIIVAKRSIAIDAVVTRFAMKDTSETGKVTQSLINRHKSMLRMNGICVWETCRTEIPIRAVQALVADSIDVLVTSVTNGVVAHISARRQQRLGDRREMSAINGGHEWVSRIMAVKIIHMAGHAHVVIGALNTRDEMLLSEFCEARVASACIELIFFRLLCVGSYSFLGLRVCARLRWNRLRDAVEDLSILDISLDEPVIVPITHRTSSDTRLAQVVIAMVTRTAVVVSIRNRIIAIVAVNVKDAACGQLR